ncbi:MAG: rRNA pseudouridine synthase [Steroidobacteraceae bacterium]|nr:rRNA pseudouridine synthase [Steroidobacteraceae bacterium]
MRSKRDFSDATPRPEQRAAGRFRAAEESKHTGPGERHRRGRPGSRRFSPSRRGHHGGRSAEGERLQKVLARMGVASRREAEDWIRAGRITVNGQPAVLGMRVTRSDRLRLDGRLIHRHEIAAGQVYLCHRSPGEHLRSPDEPSEHQALVERLPRRAGNRFIMISPMPRIDGGLELVTSDGELAATLQRTIHSLPSEFSVRVLGELTDAQLRNILDGLLDRGDRLQVESCEPSGGEGANRWYTIVARGGSGKDVRQLFERQGALVSRVLRTRVGTLVLDRHLSRGQFRPLTKDEVAALTPPEPTVT